MSGYEVSVTLAREVEQVNEVEVKDGTTEVAIRHGRRKRADSNSFSIPCRRADRYQELFREHKSTNIDISCLKWNLIPHMDDAWR